MNGLIHLRYRRVLWGTAMAACLFSGFTLTFSSNLHAAPGAFQTTFGEALTMPSPAGQPAVSLTSRSLTFSAQPVGTFSLAQLATLKNTGDGLLKITSIGRSSDFYEGNNCPSMLLPGASCTLRVTFTPTWAGSRLGAVTIWDNA